MITLEELNAKMVHGSALQRLEDPAVIYDIASRGKTYVEIGTRWGGSAIVAGIAGCEVYCIDPWEYPNKSPRDQTTPEHVRKNWDNAGLLPERLHLYQQKHPPWPEEINDRMFDIGMIDGSHRYEQVNWDWKAMRTRITLYILFHDIHKKYGKYAGANTSAGFVFEEASMAKEWETIELSFESQFGILKRAPGA